MYSKWVVKRRYRQFASLHSDLTAFFNQAVKLPTLPQKKILGSSLLSSFVDERKTALEAYLNGLNSKPELINCQLYLDFLDSLSSSLVFQIKVLKLSKQVTGLEDHCSNLHMQLNSTNESLQLALKMIGGLQEKVQQLESSSNNSNNNINRSSSGYHDNETSINESLWEQHSSNNKSHDESLSMVSLEPVSPVLVKVDSFTNYRGNSSMGTYIDTDMLSANAFGSVSSPGYFVQKILSIDHDQNDSRQEEGHPLLHHDLSLLIDGKYNSSNTSCDPLTQFQLPGPDGSLKGLLQNNTEPSIWDRLMDEIVLMVQPQEHQIHYRSSVAAFITYHTRKTLNAHIYEGGLYALRCFLPDDPILMSVFLGRSQESSWYVRLNERLCRISADVDNCKDNDTTTDIADKSYDRHILTNVSFLKDNDSSHKLQCLVDSIVGVEILLNMRAELCLLAFLEEFDILVGKNHLFKRSILLIRAWWFYEAKLTNNLISDTAMCIMICSIFNVYHDKIHFPLQALSVFFMQFSGINFTTTVMTLYGPVPYDVFVQLDEKKLFELRPVLTSREVIERYQNITRATDGIEEDVFPDSYTTFTQKPLMVAHPFLAGRNNVILDSPHIVRRLKVLSDALRSGASCVKSMQASELSQTVSPHAVVETFFKNVYARFGRGWRPDIPGKGDVIADGDLNDSRYNSWYTSTDSANETDFSRSSNQEALGLFTYDVNDGRSSFTEKTDVRSSFTETSKSKDFMKLSVDRIFDSIRYCNLLLEAQITESALRTLCIEILNDKGSLPVGEIGKMLQEAVSTSSMPALLKEKFGGLKKFLERYPDDFVMNSDHPFNPHVHLRQSLSFEEYASVLRGEVLMKPSAAASTKNNKKQRGNNNNLRQVRRSSKTPPLEAHTVHMSHTSLISHQLNQLNQMNHLNSLNHLSSLNSRNSFDNNSSVRGGVASLVSNGGVRRNHSLSILPPHLINGGGSGGSSSLNSLTGFGTSTAGMDINSNINSNMNSSMNSNMNSNMNSPSTNYGMPDPRAPAFFPSSLGNLWS